MYDIELIICWTDRCWYTNHVKVTKEEIIEYNKKTDDHPSLRDDEIEEMAKSVAKEKFIKEFCKDKKEGSSDIFYIGIYYIEEIE